MYTCDICIGIVPYVLYILSFIIIFMTYLYLCIFYNVIFNSAGIRHVVALMALLHCFVH